MSIINPKEIVIDDALRLAQVENRIRNANAELYNTIIQRHNALWNMIWNNRLGFTPQQIFDQFGTEASELFVFSGQMQTMLVSINSEYVPLVPPYNYTINADGTVTVGDIV